MGVRHANRAVPSRPLRSTSTRPRRCNTDHHNTASELLRLWAEDGAAPAPRHGSRRRQPRPKERTPEAAAGPGETSPDTTGELVLLLTIEDAGKALGVGRSTVYELIGSGDLELVHIGRSARVPVEAVQAFVRRLRAG
jgi:excisionase family DNA binding protein